MKVKIGCDWFTGTPLEVVKELGKFALLDKEMSVDKYMTLALKRVGSKKKLLDKTLEKRCKSFLKELEKYLD